MLALDFAGRMTFEHRFLQILASKLSEDADRLHVELGSGALIVADNPAATGMRCARQMGVIAGLRAAIKHISDTEIEMSQKPKRD